MTHLLGKLESDTVVDLYVSRSLEERHMVPATFGA